MCAGCTAGGPGTCRMIGGSWHRYLHTVPGLLLRRASIHGQCRNPNDADNRLLRTVDSLASLRPVFRTGVNFIEFLVSRWQKRERRSL
jgi:hypothetical protein